MSSAKISSNLLIYVWPPKGGVENPSMIISTAKWRFIGSRAPLSKFIQSVNSSLMNFAIFIIRINQASFDALTLAVLCKDLREFFEACAHKYAERFMPKSNIALLMRRI